MIKSVCFFDLKRFNYFFINLMNLEMTSEIEPREEPLFTDEALELIVAYMYCYVLVEVGFLSETFAASFVMAEEGTFPSVRSEVIEQVVPLSEGLVALVTLGVMHSADQCLQHAVGVRVLRFED